MGRHRGEDRRAGRRATVAGLVVLALAITTAVLLAWTVRRPVSAEPDRRVAADAGNPADRSTHRGDPGPVNSACGGRPVTATRELRGMWLTTVENIDFPSRPGLDEATVKAEYLGWLDLARKLGHNAIFVHVRPSGDAFYPSRFDPWSEWLTGNRSGAGPGWDPLAFMVDEAHKRNLEFHAWMNPYRGSQPTTAGGGAGPNIDALAPDHALRKHPEWAVVYPPAGVTGSRLVYNPGIPEARKYVEDAMLDVVQRYDIDGVHFDDFFYPYPGGTRQDFPDQATFEKYGGGFANRADWRRDNVNRLVQEMSQRIKALKPWVKFGISPFGIWRNAATDPAGSPTRGLQAYDDVYADTRLWVKKEWLDYVVPQLYWNIGFDLADYAKLLPWWVDTVKGTRVQLYIGQADYRVGQPGPWQDAGELTRQLALNRKYPAVTGSVHFSAKSLRTDALGSVTRYRDQFYAAPALVPVSDRLPGNAPAAPTLTAARRDGAAGVRLTWRVEKGSPATAFAVYRVDGASAALVGTVRRVNDADQSWTDVAAPTGKPLSYCVAGLDRSWNQGSLSASHTA